MNCLTQKNFTAPSEESGYKRYGSFDMFEELKTLFPLNQALHYFDTISSKKFTDWAISTDALIQLEANLDNALEIKFKTRNGQEGKFNSFETPYIISDLVEEFESIGQPELDLLVKQFSSKLGVDVKIIDDPKKEAGWFLGNTVFLNKNKLNASILFHEFSHPLVAAIYKHKNELFTTLYKEATKTTWGRKIEQEVKEDSYYTNQTKPSQEQEVLVRILGELSKRDKYSNKFLNAIAEFVEYIRSLFISENTNIGTLGLDASLYDILRILKHSKKIYTHPTGNFATFVKIQEIPYLSEVYPNSQPDDYIYRSEGTIIVARKNKKDRLEVTYWNKIEDGITDLVFNKSIILNKDLEKALETVNQLSVFVDDSMFWAPFRTKFTQAVVLSNKATSIEDFANMLFPPKDSITDEVIDSLGILTLVKRVGNSLVVPVYTLENNILSKEEVTYSINLTPTVEQSIRNIIKQNEVVKKQYFEYLTSLAKSDITQISDKGRLEGALHKYFEDITEPLESISPEFDSLGIKTTKVGKNTMIMVEEYQSDIIVNSGSSQTNLAKSLLNMDKDDQTFYNYYFKNNQASRRDFFIALAILQLQQRNPDIQIDGIRVLSSEGAVYRPLVFEVVSSIKMFQDERLEEYVPDDLKNLLNTTNFKKAFDQTAVNSLEYFLEVKDTEHTESNSALLDIIKTSNLEEIREAIKNKLKSLYKVLAVDGINPSTFYWEAPDHPLYPLLMVLTRAYHEIERMEEGVDLRHLNNRMHLTTIESYTKDAGSYIDPKINWVLGNIRSILNSVREYILTDYKNRREAIFKKFFDTVNTRTLGETIIRVDSQIYSNLFQTMDMLIAENNVHPDKWKTKKTPIMALKEVDDKTLSSTEREFLISFYELMDKEVERLVTAHFNNIGNPGLISDFMNNKYRPNRHLLPVLKGGRIENLLKNGLGAALDQLLLEDLEFETTGYLKGNYGLEALDLLMPQIPQNDTNISRLFGSEQRMRALGISQLNGKYIIENLADNNRLTFDLQFIIDYFAYQSAKSSTRPEMLTAYLSGRLLMLAAEAEKRNYSKADISAGRDALDSMVARLLNNERTSIIAGHDTDIGKLADFVRRTTTAMALSFNIASPLLALSSGFFGLLTNTSVNRFGDAFFGFNDLGSAVSFLASSPKKFFNLIDKFFAINEGDDTSIMFDDFHKTKSTGEYETRFATKTPMMLLRMADRISKGVVLVAQLYKDNLFANIVFEDDGQIWYDWSKDNRPTPIIQHLKKQAKKWNRLTNDEGFPRIPYDDRTLMALELISTKLFGTISDNTKNRGFNNPIFQAVLSMRTWVLGKFDDVFSRKYVNENIATNSVDEDNNFTLNMMTVSGVGLSSLKAVKAFFYAMQVYSQTSKWEFSKYSNLDKTEVTNLKKLGVDIITWGIMTIMYSGLISLLTDEKDERRNRKLMYLKFMILDIVAAYNMHDYLDAITPIFVTKILKVGDATIDLITLQEGSITKAIKTTSFGNTSISIYEALNEK